MKKQEFQLQTFDKLKLFACEWSPEEKPRAIVIHVHGLGEHSQRYIHVAEAFTTAGISLFSFDLRGHGRSPGIRGDFPSFDAVLNDMKGLASIASQKFPGIPLVLYGHSLGGLLVLQYALADPKPFTAVISTAPGLRMAVDPSPVKVAVVKVIKSILPTLQLSNDLDRSGLSRDETVVTTYCNDPLVHDRITTRFGFEGLESGKWVRNNPDKLSIPLLLLQGSADRIVNPQAVREFAANCDGKVTFKEYEGYYHELHNEPEKAQVIQFMIDWIKSKAG